MFWIFVFGVRKNKFFYVKKIYKYLIIVFKINIKKMLVKKIVDIWYVCKLKGNRIVLGFLLGIIIIEK